MPDLLLLPWPAIVTVASFVLAIFTSAHVVLNKRDVRAAISWVGLIWLTPLVGSLLYLALGINRMQRRTRRMIAIKTRAEQESSVKRGREAIRASEAAELAHLATLASYGDRVIRRPLLAGNEIVPLVDGDIAYRSMLDAIGQAKQSISLATYIFDNDEVGKMFVAALADAKQRGVEVRVLIDDVGIRYTWPSIRWPLGKAGIRYATFLPTLLPWKWHYSNLRNHRKLLVVDGQIGFTGGMNIRSGHMLSLSPAHPVRDLHFRLAGPVAAQLQEAFAVDWEFATGESLQGDVWFPQVEPAGSMLARGITDGPDQKSDRIRLTMMGALACAQKSVTVVTPYFLPDSCLIYALSTADLRGVDVQIVLPEKNNLRLVQWASTAELWQVLRQGVQVWHSPPPFDHTKLMIVDDRWVMFGSANWDPRSLRLNFEFNVECYDAGLAARLKERVAHVIALSRPVTLADVNGRPLWKKLRDGVARLLSPYL